MTGRDDAFPPDERDYLDDPALRDTAELVRRVLRADHMRPAFRDRLRADIVAARAEAIRRDPRPGAVPPAQVSAPWQYPADQQYPGDQQYPAAPRPGMRRPPARRPPARANARRRRSRRAILGLLATATAAAAALVVLVVVGLPAPPPGTGPVALAVHSDASGEVSADPAAAVRITFSQPVDHVAVQNALRLAPYAATTPHWDGDTLVVAPAHGFAPNTGYLLTIDHRVARTATGRALAADLHVAFGTAPRAGEGPPAGPPLTLHRNVVASAAEDSEAVVTRDGSLLLTDGSAGGHSGLLRVGSLGVEPLSGPASAICVSRSGDSIAYLDGSGAGTQLVFANAFGTRQGRVPVDIDKDSPLGWLNDDRVTYLHAGRLVAIDRAGHRRDLGVPVDAAAVDDLVIAPGGGYVYVPGRGVVPIRDLHAAAAHTLAGISGAPAFSADGATVIWIDMAGGKPLLAVAPSAGGPVLTSPLPVSPGDQISDLAVSPDDTHFVYSVAHNGATELRLAALPDGDTLAVSPGGAGLSPNWSPSGHSFTILDQSARNHVTIDTVALPQSLRDRAAALEAAASVFANAQLSGDTDALRFIAAAGVTPAPPAGARATRATVVWVLDNADGTATALVRLTADPTAEHPAALRAEETLTLGVPRPGALAKVLKVGDVQPWRPAAGPQLVHLDTDAVPGAVRLTFDSDLDPDSLGAISLVTPDGRPVEVTPSVDGPRAVSLTPASGVHTVRLVIDERLRDARGDHLTNPVDVTVTLGG